MDEGCLGSAEVNPEVVEFVVHVLGVELLEFAVDEYLSGGVAGVVVEWFVDFGFNVGNVESLPAVGALRRTAFDAFQVV